MSGGGKEEVGFVPLIGFLFVGLLAMCALEFLDNVGKGELKAGGGKGR